MLDLRDDAITDWAKSVPEEIGRIPNPSTNDPSRQEAVAEALARLGELLEERGGTDAAVLVNSLRDQATLDEMRAVLGHGGVRPVLRLIAWLAEELPGGIEISTLLLDKRGGTLGGLLAESERSALLLRLFAPDRLRSLEEACRDATIVSEAA